MSRVAPASVMEVRTTLHPGVTFRRQSVVISSWENRKKGKKDESRQRVALDVVDGKRKGEEGREREAKGSSSLVCWSY